MFRDLTKKQLRKRRRRRILAAVVAAVIVFVFIASFGQASASMKKQGELSLKNAVLESAKQCCAIEGSYPSSVQYLENNYGLIIDHSKYLVSYDIFAANVMPSVVVVEK